MNQDLFLVLDIGGTTLRSAVYDPVQGAIADAQREPVHNFLSQPGVPVATVQANVIAQLQRLIARRCEQLQAQGRSVRAVGLSFAGPIDAQGRVLSAATIWGAGGAPLAVGDELSRRLGGLPVHALNDVTAAAWRYADRHDEPFCLITVSSGVGNKVFWGREVLVNRHGHGGEIGHQRIDFAADALPCDCGGRGHLGGIASGRGSVAVARRFAAEDPAAFRASRLAALCGPDPAGLSSYHLVRAALDGDAFAQRCVRHGIGCMAQAISGLYAAIGVRRYLFMGGFALALGPQYLAWLAEALRDIGLFGIAGDEVASLLELADADDDHGLVGAGRYLAQRVRA
ncbi:MAG: ROK family protein [Pseudomonadota bacterium]